MKDIAVVVGSLRADSTHRKLAEAVAGITQDLFRFRYADIGALPHYNDDLNAASPAPVTALRDTVAAADGILFLTPEYNRNVPGVLCNALDWGSRPSGQSCWAGKPASVLCGSPGPISAAVAGQHMRSRAVALGMVVMGTPEVYLRFGPDFLDAGGGIAQDDTRAFLRRWAEAFAGFIGKLA